MKLPDLDLSCLLLWLLCLAAAPQPLPPLLTSLQRTHSRRLDLFVFVFQRREQSGIISFMAIKQ